MANNIGTLAVYLTAHTSPFKRNIYSAQRTVGQFSQRVQTFAKVGLLALGLGLAASAREFANFDSAMTRSLAITKGVSAEIRAEMGQTARDISNYASFTSSELAGGYFFLSSAGKSLAASQRELGDVARFAQAGQFDLSTATTLLADSQKALRLSSANLATDQKNLIRVSDVLVKANTLANANVQEFAEALSNDAAAAMYSFNIKLEEGVAVLAAYAEQGKKGQEAGSSFARFLRLLIPSANKNKEAFEKLNIQVFNSQGNLRKLADILKDMELAFKDMSVAEKSAALESLGFQKKMQGAIFPLLGVSENVRNFEADLLNAGGTTREVAENQLGSLSAQLGLLKNNLQNTISEALNYDQVIKDSTGTVSNFTKHLQSLDNPTKAFAVRATLAAAAVTGLGLAAKGLGLWSLTKAFFTLAAAAGAKTVATWSSVAATAAMTRTSLAAAAAATLQTTAVGGLTAMLGTLKVAAIGVVSTLGMIAAAAGVAFVAFNIGKWIGQLDAVKSRLEWVGDWLYNVDGEKARSASLDKKLADLKKKREELSKAGKLSSQQAGANPHLNEKANEKPKSLADLAAEEEKKKNIIKLDERWKETNRSLQLSRMTAQQKYNFLLKERNELEKKALSKDKETRLKAEIAMMEKQKEIERQKQIIDQENKRSAKKTELDKKRKQQEKAKEAKAQLDTRISSALVRGSIQAFRAEAQSKLDGQILKANIDTARSAKQIEELIKNKPALELSVVRA